MAILNLLDKEVRVATIKMCRVFQRIYEKEVREDALDALMRDEKIATCRLEQEFPLTFLNVMAHLRMHLVEQLFICGTVHCK